MNDFGNKEIFSKNLKYYMKENKKDRNKICSDLGFKYTTFRDWEKGYVYPRIDKIEILANYFDIQKSDLIEDKEKKISEKKDPLYKECVRLGLIKDGDDLSDKQKELLIKLIDATSDVLLSLKDDSQK